MKLTSVKEVSQDGSRIMPIRHSFADMSKSFLPVLLHLPGNGPQKGVSVEFFRKACKLDVFRVMNSGRVLLRPSGMNGTAIWTSPALHPQSKGKSNKIS